MLYQPCTRRGPAPVGSLAAAQCACSKDCTTRHRRGGIFYSSIPKKQKDNVQCRCYSWFSLWCSRRCSRRWWPICTRTFYQSAAATSTTSVTCVWRFHRESTNSNSVFLRTATARTRRKLLHELVHQARPRRDRRVVPGDPRPLLHRRLCRAVRRRARGAEAVSEFAGTRRQLHLLAALC